MELKEIGEFGLIDLIKQDCIVDASSVVIGIGDDAAAIIPTKNMLELISTDMLMEGIHFDLSFISPFQLGYKSLAVNLSDIAAMGGMPKQVVVSIALPKQIETEFILELYRGMKELAHQFGVNIVGGDTVSSLHGIAINVTVIGEVTEKKLQKRSGAKPGDLVVVTGSLGSSAAGLALLQNGGYGTCDFYDSLVKAHLMPLPQVSIANDIANYSHSMNDISDGLASEAKEIALASGVGMRLYAEKIPLSPDLIAASRALKTSALSYALYGGEDYQLIFTITPEQYQLLKQYHLVNHITVIGEVTPQNGVVELVQEDQQIVQLESKGYNHFI